MLQMKGEKIIMKLPNIDVLFSEKAIHSLKMAERGIVALVLHHNCPEQQESIHTLNSLSELDNLAIELTEKQKKYIKLAFLGNDNVPRKVILVMRESSADVVDLSSENSTRALKKKGLGTPTYTKVFNLLDSIEFNYLAFPQMTTEKTEIETWVKQNRKKFLTVIGGKGSNNERIINFNTGSIKTILSDDTFSKEEYTARIAGLIAGTSVKQSITFAKLSDVLDCERAGREAIDTAIESGELVLYTDGEVVKIARGITSLTTLSSEKGEQFKKIKVVDVLNMIENDIKSTCESVYIGKYPNTYDNKIVLASSITNYFKRLEMLGILDNNLLNTCEIDFEMQKRYLADKGIDVENLSEKEILRYNTNSQVFLFANIHVVDAIEDIKIRVSI